MSNDDGDELVSFSWIGWGFFCFVAEEGLIDCAACV
jgi:hypothetical protein